MPSPETAWWRDAVVYEIYVRSFADGDGDGVGDLAGVRHRLPHLAHLGVDALWLTPFYRSPMADGGYDVADHRDVDPLFGSLDDVDALLREAHALGLRVLVDIVPNHVSSEHAWFRAALTSPTGSPERARFVFRDGRGPDGELPPNNWESDFGGPAWTRTTGPDGRPGEWYLHLFAPEQPDVDWQHPEVRSHFEDILRFWLDRGVDGLRIDVAHGLAKAEGLPDNVPDEDPPRAGIYLPTGFQWDQPAVHDVYRSWRRILDSYAGERTAIGEAWVRTAESMARYVRPDELHQVFDFHVLQARWDAAELRAAVRGSIDAVASVGAPPSWVLSNHDVVRHVTRYGGGTVGLRRARAAALLILALPGSIYLYQGEELGLPEVVLPDAALRDPTWERSGHTRRGRDGCRVPVPWESGSPSFGFSAPADPDTVGAPWLPMPADWGDMSVASQEVDPSSMLNLYRQALAVRRDHVVPVGQDVTWPDAPDDAMVFRRGPITVITAFGDEPVAAPPGCSLLLASGPLGPDGATPRDTTSWWREN